MAIITLTTDFGHKDHFVGAIKGTIYKELSDAKIVDISHSIAPFNIQECAYILKNSYKNFPDGSIHIVGVDSELTPENQHIAVLVDNHYFIMANNGVIGLIISEIVPEKVVEIQLPNSIDSSFPEMDVFVKAASHIARGGKLEVIGRTFKDLKDLREFNPRISDDGKTISGSVIYIDNYGNVVTNIQQSTFKTIGKGRPFELHARNKKIKEIHKKYSDIINYSLDKSQRKSPGELLALFNSSGYVEIAIYKSDLNTVGGASTLLGLDYRDTVIINFT
ncbi:MULTISPECIES: SAM hydrolase/SAM-dependent halogenase family protein [Arenibacter]|uniref:SAM hydrolase/SAM-dependent halogenase family protein n=1 Tax=Arenibacter TaxID=178469 RepID=UPI0004DF7733|nr:MULTISPECIES: SAM-dependent chlorinase/fluorinase [Arenibacter]GBF21123.1 adenosyl-chloride synthase [Arenibacter sp. NBRC 103722]|tara:strand:+ start:39737 stop:40567 length:831 start_codon:yes stop_codon:yes gene_type:complete|eukprot:TRINITY_DN5712_c0_g1_i1.p1 TRINITY_DN5712_c0_g1~~TRINITY_DN5712_c0_g1_i1.p1  ORF type:complete len:277 (-),score=49.06 TRINITY_DN5712_c0_g1_i1:195-1025(-)